MWRALFMAIAISICLLGLECMVVKQAILTSHAPAASSQFDASDPFAGSLAAASPKRTIQPAEWHSWSLLSVGSVLMLYSLMLNKGA